MDESEFIRQSGAVFDYLEEISDDWDDFDCLRAGNVLTFEHEDGAQIVVNRHTANGELWIAARSGGYHFVRNAAGQWFSLRENRDFFAVLSQVLSETAGREITVAAP